MKKTFLVLSVAVVIFLGAGCSASNNSGTSTAPGAAAGSAALENQVNINHFVFEPNVLTIKTGQTVTWVHDDNVSHTIVSGVSGSLFESPVLKRGDTYDFTFNTPGQFTYYCSIHPSMKGTIIVE